MVSEIMRLLSLYDSSEFSVKVSLFSLGLLMKRFTKGYKKARYPVI